MLSLVRRCDLLCSGHLATNRQCAFCTDPNLLAPRHERKMACDRRRPVLALCLPPEVSCQMVYAKIFEVPVAHRSSHSFRPIYAGACFLLLCGVRPSKEGEFCEGCEMEIPPIATKVNAEEEPKLSQETAGLSTDEVIDRYNFDC